MGSLWNISNKKETAVVEQGGNHYTYEQLYNDVMSIRGKIKSSRKQLVILLARNNYISIVHYLAVWENNDAVMLINPDLPDKLLHSIIDSYQALWILGDLNHPDYQKYDTGIYKRRLEPNYVIHSDLALMLSTSGTTGSVKFVRLTKNNVLSNAKAIIHYLEITSADRGIVNLPMHYSYGLSIINSHLNAGATILVTNDSVLTKSFWEFIREEKATSIAGVPYTYQMLQRIGYHKMELPDLRYFTQAGGRLNEKLTRFFGEYAKDKGKNFYVMYGQTEAAPRISYIPPERLLEKPNSIGKSIPGGRLSLDLITAELIYEGPNVMMGYAESLTDLAEGDLLHGILRTGDVADVDEEGFYYIKGRLKRFIKLFGLRLNLDDIEKEIESSLNINTICIGTDDKLMIIIENEDQREKVGALVEKLYKLHRSAFQIRIMEEFPRLSNGKVNYEAVKDLVT